jgi:enoyl-CoA hydratase
VSGPLVRIAFPAPAPFGAGQPLAGVALLTIDRPEALNAVSFATIAELASSLGTLDADPACRCAVLTGAGTRAFAAGADIRELSGQTPESLRSGGAFDRWDDLRRIGLPIIAAVRGYALGGGCELAMACDLIVADEDAQFGQPEIKLGVIPGAGGTQRLTRAIGKARAMELILTGRSIGAREAAAAGLVNLVVPAEEALDRALELAGRIAAMPPLAVRAAKAMVNRVDDAALTQGLADERQAFFDLFATEDQAEGMAAFTEKRTPTWRGR